MARATPAPPLQLITGRWTDTHDLLRRVEGALAGGVRWIQLRAKERGGGELYEAARAALPLARRAGAMLVVNDRVDVAVAAGLDGVHLPESGLDPRAARRLLGDGAWIARSVHSAREAGFEAEGAAAVELDALQFGHVFDTASKRPFAEPRGLGALHDAAVAASASGRRLVAVGGIDAGNVAACFAAGADAVAVIGAVWDAPDVEAAARAMVAACLQAPPR